MIGGRIRDRLHQLLEVRPPRPGELGRLLDEHTPGAELVLDGMGDRCWWRYGNSRSAGFDALRIVAEAEAAGLARADLVDALVRLDDDPAWRRLLERAAGRPVVEPSAVEQRRVAARAVWPHLEVRRVRDEAGELLDAWGWSVRDPAGGELAPGEDSDAPVVLPSQAAAFEVGLAHLAVQSAGWAIDRLGAELPAGFVRLG